MKIENVTKIISYCMAQNNEELAVIFLQDHIDNCIEKAIKADRIREAAFKYLEKEYKNKFCSDCENSKKHPTAKPCRTCSNHSNWESKKQL